MYKLALEDKLKPRLLLFDECDLVNYVPENVDTNVGHNDSFTLAARVMIIMLGDEDERYGLLIKGDSNQSYGIDIVGRNIIAGIDYNGMSYFYPVMAVEEFEQRRWYHIALTFSPENGMRIYTDGELIKQVK